MSGWNSHSLPLADWKPASENSFFILYKQTTVLVAESGFTPIRASSRNRGGIYRSLY